MKLYNIPYKNRELGKSNELKWFSSIKRWIGENDNLAGYEKELEPYEIYDAGGYDNLGKECIKFRQFLFRWRQEIGKNEEIPKQYLAEFNLTWNDSALKNSFLSIWEIYSECIVVKNTDGFWRKSISQINEENKRKVDGFE